MRDAPMPLPLWRRPPCCPVTLPQSRSTHTATAATVAIDHLVERYEWGKLAEKDDHRLYAKRWQDRETARQWQDEAEPPAGRRAGCGAALGRLHGLLQGPQRVEAGQPSLPERPQGAHHYGLHARLVRARVAQTGR
jgi:hypothetical protein